MTTSDKIAALLICCLLNAGCGMTTAALGSRVAVEKMPELPGDWADYAAESTAEFGCPDVNGEYRMAADVYQISDGDIEESTSATFIHASLFLGPLDAEKVETIASDRGPFLRLERTEREALILTAYADRLDSETSWRLPVGAPGLACVGKFYELPVREYQSLGEFYIENSQIHSRFARLEDGSLIYYEQVGPLKRLLGAGANFTHRFYRFRPLDQDETATEGENIGDEIEVSEQLSGNP